jgi:hypothetical protein
MIVCLYVCMYVCARLTPQKRSRTHTRVRYAKPLLYSTVPYGTIPYRTVHNNTKALPYGYVPCVTISYGTLSYRIYPIERRGAALMAGNGVRQ